MRLSVRVWVLLSLMLCACSDKMLWNNDDDDDDDDDELQLEDFQEAFPEGHFEGSVAIDVSVASLGHSSISDDCLGNFFLDVHYGDDPQIRGKGECFFQSGLMDYVTTRNEGKIIGWNTGEIDSNTANTQGQIWVTIVGDNRDEVISHWTGGANRDDIYAEFDGKVAFQVVGQMVDVDYVGFFTGSLVHN